MQSRRGSTWSPLGWLLGAASVAGGITLATLGSTTHLTFWDNKSYYINIMSAFTGALFGVPFAIFFLYKITASQTEKTQWQITKRLLSETILELIEASESPVATGPEGKFLTKLHEALKNAQEPAHELHKRIAQQYSWGASSPLRMIDDYDFYVETRKLVQQTFSIQGWAETCVVDPKLLERYSKIAERRWVFLDTYLRPRVLEAGKPWLPASTYADLSILFYKEFNYSTLIDICSNDSLGKKAHDAELWAAETKPDKYKDNWNPSSEIDRAVVEVERLLELGVACQQLREYLESLSS